MGKELKLYIVRHGQTEWNVLEKFQGQLNSPLTKEGKDKVRVNWEELLERLRLFWKLIILKKEKKKLKN